MPAAPTPANESQRLAAIASYPELGAARADWADRLAEIAANITGCPIAIVSIVGRNHQWFKGVVGLDCNTTPRSQSFCAFNLAGPEPLIVPDAAADPRFADNPLVTGEPHLRFYAGAPIIDPNGFTLGSLCIIDTNPRTAEPNHISLIERLAAVAAETIARSRAADPETSERANRARLRRESDFLRLVRASVDRAHDAIYWISTEGEIRFANTRAAEMLGYDEQEIPSLTVSDIGDENWTRERFQDFVQQIRRDGHVRTVENHHRRDGSVYLAEIDCSLVEIHGETLVCAFARDITEQVERQKRLAAAEETLRLFVENTPAAVAMFDRDLRYLIASRGWYEQYGIEPDSVTGRCHYDIFPTIPERWKELHSRCLAGESLKSDKDRFADEHGNDIWINWRLEPWRDAAGEIGGLIMFTQVITDRVNAEHQALIASQRLELALDAAEMGLWDWNITDDSTFFNDTFYTMLGYAPGELPMNLDTWAGLCHPEDLTQALEEIERHKQGETELYRSEQRLRGKDGGWHWVLDVGKVVERDHNGAPLRMIGFHISIDDQVNREAELRELTSAMDAANDCIFVFEAGSLNFCYANHGAIRQVGYTTEELMRMRPFDLKPKLDEATFRHMLEPLVDHRIPHLAFRTIHQSKVGERVPVDVSVRYLPSLGEAGRFIAIVRDVSHQLEAEQLLKDARDRAESALADAATLRAVLDKHALFSITDRSGRIMEVNEGFCRIAGYTREELIGANHRILNSGHHPKHFWVNMWRTIAAGNPWRGEVCNRAKDGSLYWVDSTNIPKFDNAGNIEGYISLRFDITSRKLVEHQLEAAKEAALDASRAKSEFLANMSHEIRTPLGAILGYTDLILEDGITPDDTASHAETIQRNATHLLKLINDILDSSKIDAGKMTIEPLPTDTAAVIREAASLLTRDAQAKGIEIAISIDERLPESITTDPTRLRQILVNLLANAVKFTEHGRVNINATPEGDNAIRVAVTDTGIGISPDQLERIQRFEAFTQADGTTSRRFGGTGLGLRISHALAKALGGSLHIESKIGKGSTFTLTIGSIPAHNAAPNNQHAGPVPHPANEPAPSTKPNTPTAPPSLPLAGLRVLVAEDGPDNQRLINHHLTRAGATVTIANNGIEALQAIRNEPPQPDSATPKQTPFDILFLDIQMPELDGYETARILRAENNNIPIVALTAHAMDGDERKCLQAGCDAYLTKPASKAALVDAALVYTTRHDAA